jgi:LuxR family maltose regulon positive regulatory protein
MAAFTKVQIEVEQTLARVEAGLRVNKKSLFSEAEVALLQRRVRLLRAWIDTRALVQQADVTGLQLLTEEASDLAEQEEVSWKLLALSFSFWFVYTFRQAEPRLISRLLEVKEQAVQLGAHGATLRTIVFLAHLYLADGRLYQLEQECREGIDRAAQLGVETAAFGNLHLLLAEVYYAWNRLDEADHALHTGLRVAKNWAHQDMYLWGSTLLGRLELARDDGPAADRALHQAEAMVQQERFWHWAHTVAAARVQYWLVMGDHAKANAWLAQTSIDPHTMAQNQNMLVFARIQILLAQRQYLSALEMLERFAGQFDRPGHVPTSVTFLAFYLVALHGVGRYAPVRAVAQRLFALTEPEDNFRVYLDVGAAMRQVLRGLQEAPGIDDEAVAAQFTAYVAKLLATFASEVQDEVGLPPPPLALEQRPTSGPPTLTEPLTRREREVLPLLVSGASNQEIARDLVISLATAKKHVSNILGKLGVATRAQAIAEVRRSFERL